MARQLQSHIVGLTATIFALLGTVSAQQAVAAAASNYAPSFVACPPSATPLLRLAGTAVQSNQTLSSGEQAYRAGRRQVTAPLWQEYLTSGTGKGTGYDVSALVGNATNMPTLAIAHSGGGYRAALYAASVVQALDIRTSSSAVAGVLQLATYQSGLSGGSWFLSSAVLNGYPTMSQLVKGSNPGWLLDKDLIVPDGILGVPDNNDYLNALKADVAERAGTGFNTSITDLWGRALAYHLLPGTTESNFFDAPEGTSHGAGILFSSVQSQPIFTNFSIPFPIITACNRPPAGQINGPDTGSLIPLDTTVWEFNPYEFGSYDPYLASFTPMQYLGTYLNAGQPYVPSFVNRTNSATGDCVTGFDQASFVYGTSSSLFNAITAGITDSFSSSDAQIIQALGAGLQNSLSASDVDVANYPNSFRGVNGPSGFDRTGDAALQLVDGGENGENVPIGPLLVKARGVDVIITADGSADTISGAKPNGAHWPNGTSLVVSQNRVKNVLPAGTANFPSVPTDQAEWVSKGLNQRPTFFGCDDDQSIPLVIYLPNSPAAQNQYKFFANTSTYKLQYSDKDVASFLTSATASTTAGFVTDGKADTTWPTCLACALVDRARTREGIARSSACQTCFTKYCFSESMSTALPDIARTGGAAGMGSSRSVWVGAIAAAAGSLLWMI